VCFFASDEQAAPDGAYPFLTAFYKQVAPMARNTFKKHRGTIFQIHSFD
jgi:hypothetical protein